MEFVNKTVFTFAPLIGNTGSLNYSLTLLIKGTFDLVPETILSLADDQLYPTGDEPYPDDEEGLGSPRYESDFAHYKTCADLMLVGKCHPPSQNPVQACQVTFQVGDHSKTLDVIGDRHWHPITGIMSEPEPFKEIILRYENSFGGTGFDKNPVGKGYESTGTGSGENQRLLPNIEDPRQRISSPKSRPDPAGFGPVCKIWQQRFSKLGTYNEKWLKERWPWFPDDFEMGFYNAAPPDMQITDYLQGDESLYFENLHPKHSHYQSKLPGIRIRLFLNKKDPGATGEAYFVEMPMNLDTLWVDMESEQLVLLWRGVTSVQSEDYEEVLHAYIVSEQLSDPAKPLEYYRQQFHQFLIDEDKPEGAAAPEPEPAVLPGMEGVDVEKEILAAEGELKQALKKAGVDPPPEISEPSQEDKQKDIQLLKELGIDTGVPEPVTRDVIQKRIKQKDSFCGEDLRGINLSGIIMQGIDFSDTILAGVDLQGADLTHSILKNADLSNSNITTANLSKADLTDADLTGADLTGCSLREATIEDAIFDNARLNGAILDRSFAKYASFCSSDLTKATFIESSCVSADFSKAILHEVSFQGADLSEASVEKSSCIKVDMTNANLTGFRASGDTDLSRGIFRNVVGPYSIWENAILDGADFTSAKMEGANFSSASLRDATFLCADMKYARFIKTNLMDARLLTVNLFQGNLEKANLTRTDLRGANLYGAEFLDALLSETRLNDANLKMTKLSDREYD